MKFNNELEKNIRKQITQEYTDKLVSFASALNDMRNIMLEQINEENNENILVMKYGHLSTIDTMLKLFNVTFEITMQVEKKEEQQEVQ